MAKSAFIDWASFKLLACLQELKGFVVCVPDRQKGLDSWSVVSFFGKKRRDEVSNIPVQLSNIQHFSIGKIATFVL